MKKIITLSVLSLLMTKGTDALAQRNNLISNLLKQNSRQSQQSAVHSFKRPQATPTANDFYRLQAVATYWYEMSGFEFADSTTYKWDADRGNIERVLAAFDLYSYADFQSEIDNFVLSNMLWTYFDSEPDFTTQMLYETGSIPDYTLDNYFVNNQKDSSMDSYGYYRLFGYDANGNQVSILHYDASNVLESYDSAVYDTNGNLIKQINGASYYRNEDRLYYDGNNKLTAHHYISYDMPGSIVNEQYYDSVFVLTSGLDSTVRYDEFGAPQEQTYTYHTNGVLDTVVYVYSLNDIMKFNCYRNSNQELDSVIISENNQASMLMRFFYNANGEHTTTELMDLNDPEGSFKEEMGYDANGNAVTYETYSAYNILNNTWEQDPGNDVLYNLYYELYEGEPESINTLSPADIAIYPNPAAHHITVATQEGAINNLVIFDAMGRMVLSKQIGVNEREKVQIDVAQLPTGNYIIQLQTSNGNGAVQFVKE